MFMEECVVYNHGWPIFHSILSGYYFFAWTRFSVLSYGLQCIWCGHMFYC